MEIGSFRSRRLAALALAGVALALIVGCVSFVILHSFGIPPKSLTQGTSSPPTLQEVASAVSHASVTAASSTKAAAQAVQKQAAAQSKSSTSQQNLEAIQASEAAQGGQ